MEERFISLAALSVSSLQTRARLEFDLLSILFYFLFHLTDYVLDSSAQLVWFKDESKVVCIPVVVAVSCQTWFCYVLAKLIWA